MLYCLGHTSAAIMLHFLGHISVAVMLYYSGRLVVATVHCIPFGQWPWHLLYDQCSCYYALPTFWAVALASFAQRSIVLAFRESGRTFFQALSIVHLPVGAFLRRSCR